MGSHICVLLFMLSKVIMLDYDFDLMCIVIVLNLGYFYMTIGVYIGYIDDVMIVYKMT